MSDEIAQLLADMDELLRQQRKLADAQFWLAQKVVPALEGTLVDVPAVQVLGLVERLQKVTDEQLRLIRDELVVQSNLN